MQPSSIVITLREPQDEHFILDTWARSYRVSDSCKEIPIAAFRRWHRPRMLKILARAQTYVARDRESPNFIFGYGVFERVHDAFVAHWLYTKSTNRREGVANRILAHALRELGIGATSLLATHRTYIADHAESLGFKHVKLTDVEPYREVDREVSTCA